EARDVCGKFLGKIKQLPPAFSALKIGGVRAYKLAREEKEVKLAPRIIEIYGLTLLSFDQKRSRATYEAICSKGTYVRSLARDLSLCLQSLGFVVELRRTKVGAFEESNSLKIDEQLMRHIEALQNKLLENCVMIEAVLDDIPVLDATSAQAKQIKFGQECRFDSENLESVWIRFNGRLIAIGSIKNGGFIIARVFNLIE